VAASGGGTSNFLRADGTWQAPPSGGSGISGATIHGVTIASGATTIGSSVVLGANQILVGAAGADPAAQTVSGDLTLSGGAFTIGNGAVTYAKIQNVAALSVVGRSTNTAGVAADITGTANQVLVVNNAGTVLGFSTVNLGSSAAVSGILGPTFGGTGVNNGANTITLGGNVSTGGALTVSGAFGTTLTVTGTTSVTLPTSGTLLSTTTAFANPTSPGVNLTGANGSATTGMRSDAVLVLDQAIVPSWTGQHTYNVARTLASATALNLDDINVQAATTTITGNTGSPITRLAKVGLYRPTITDSTAVTVTDAATLYIDNSPLAAGSLTMSNTWSLLVGAGNVKFSGTANSVGTITAGTWNGSNIDLGHGGTNATLTASNGGIVYSTGSAMAILAGTATANLPLLSGASTTPSWAAITYPTSATSGGIPYFSSTTAMASSALLTTNAIVKGGGAGAAPSASGVTLDASNNATGFGSITGSAWLALSAPASKTGTAYTVAATDSSLVLNPSGTFTLTLPTASTNTGRILHLDLIAAFAINSATSNVVLVTGGSAGTTIMPATDGAWCMLQSDGTNWIQMEYGTPSGGGVTGPGSSVDQDLAAFSGTGGSTLIDSGFKMSHVGDSLHRLCGGM
jgi:hypothetical protein